MAMLKVLLLCFTIPVGLMTTCSKNGTNYKRYRGLVNTFKSVPESAGSMVKCISACQLSLPVCIGVSYDELKKTCDLLDSVMPGSSTEVENSKQTLISGNYKFIYR